MTLYVDTNSRKGHLLLFKSITYEYITFMATVGVIVNTEYRDTDIEI